MPVFLITIGLLLSPFVFRPIVVVIHELGHALTVLLLTRRPATVYIGLTRTGTQRTYHLRVGLLKLDFCLSWKSLFWGGGYCVSSVLNLPLTAEFLYVLAGPLASTVVACLAFAAALALDVHGAIKLLICYFLVAGLLDAVANLRPNPEPVKLPDGSVTYNDGYLLVRLWHRRRVQRTYREALSLYQQEAYARAAALFVQCARVYPKSAEMLCYGIAALMRCRGYAQAYDLGQQLREQHAETAAQPDLWYTHALAASRLDRHTEALVLYSELLKSHPDYVNAYNNRGFTHNLLGNHAAALADFEQALALEPDSAYTLSNRGLAKIKLGQTTDGLADINRALEQDPNQAYAYRNLGIYHLDRQEPAQAAAYLERAKALDAETQMIDQLIAQAQSGYLTAV